MTPRPTRVPIVATLLFFSGACALIYQVAWLRELRLIFGASTPASAAVLAIFMGGLGLGASVLGKRADTHGRALMLYGNLELMVAAWSAATPLLVIVARKAYLALGGATALGATGATLARLVLAALVLGGPTFLMGGTLPAAVRSVESRDDVRRRRLAVLYGINTLGAVLGAAVSTFLLLEVFGIRITLWMACLVNALVGVSARALARAPEARDSSDTSDAEKSSAVDLAEAAESPRSRAPVSFVLISCALVGFAFLLMELVWYRMLAPLLGGSSYTFGLVLAVALFGIGLGGASFALVRRDRRATLAGFSLTCALEALFIAIPYALGDRLAVLTLCLRPLQTFGFAGQVAGWTVIAAIVIVPAAFVAGVQFPLLIGLLGRGEQHVARHVGAAYAWNTGGSIVGSLAGGFLLLPLLTAQGAWRAVIFTLGLLAIASVALALWRGARLYAALAPSVAAVFAALLVFTAGPTAAWRHSPIGAGRADSVVFQPARNDVTAWLHEQRHQIAWQRDGLEAGLALNAANGYSFIVNGKSDGASYTDAPTQVMGGLVGALLHGSVHRALVIGLGTGSTAGWLGALRDIEAVDVVELEPAMIDVARACEGVSLAVLDNPKVHIAIGDAREVLLTSRKQYDLIFSEPSNPYRAGISSLFTEEFYRASAQRLSHGGIFVQWIQAYEIEAASVRRVMATLSTAFAHVETWHSQSGDLLLLASSHAIPYDVAELRARVAIEPYRSAMLAVWRVADLEGLLAHHLAGPSLARDIAQEDGSRGINTDDQNFLEFALARSVGKNPFNDAELSSFARRRHEERPIVGNGDVDWSRVDEHRSALPILYGGRPNVVVPEETLSPGQRQRMRAEATWAQGDVEGALRLWRLQPKDAESPLEVLLVGEGLADRGDDAALPYIERARAVETSDADALLARLRWRQGNLATAATSLEAMIRSYQRSPWATQGVVTRTLPLALEIAASDVAAGERLFELLGTPFRAEMMRSSRFRLRLDLAFAVDPKRLCVAALAPYEPHPVWTRDFLSRRARCYSGVGHPLSPSAAADLALFDEAAGSPFAEE